MKCVSSIPKWWCLHVVFDLPSNNILNQCPTAGWFHVHWETKPWWDIFFVGGLLAIFSDFVLFSLNGHFRRRITLYLMTAMLDPTKKTHLSFISFTYGNLYFTQVNTKLLIDDYSDS